MKPIKLFTVAAAVLAIVGALAASALAESLPNVLPEGTAAQPVNAATTSAESVFGNGLLKVKSKKSTGSQSGNAVKLGSFENKFQEVKDALGRTCTGLTDGEGNVTVTGTFHIRDFKENGTLLTASIQLLSEVHFSCGTLLILVKGCVAGALTPENVSTKTLTLTLAKNGNSNDNLIITVLKESNEGEEACQLLAKFDEGAVELTAQQQVATITGFTKTGSGEVLALVMRL